MTYTNKLMLDGKELAEKAKINDILTLQTIRQLRGKGKKGSKIMETLRHTQMEMTASSRKGSSMIGSTAITDSVKLASYTKLNPSDNFDSEGKDKLIGKAKKVRIIEMRKLLSSYYIMCMNGQE